MLINLRNALMAGKRLPYDAEVEYLESSGTQYVDTLVNADSNLSVEITMANAGTPWSNVNPMGAILTTPRARHHLSFDNAIYYYFSKGDQGVFSGIRPSDGTVFTYKVDAIAKTFSVNSSAFSLPNDTFDLGMTYWLFGRNGTTPPYLGALRIYSAKLWNGNTLVRDYIPVRKGTVGYLYDRVSGKLFGNAGTGDFVLGPDVVPVEYIESHGREYIDTGVYIHPDNAFSGEVIPLKSNVRLFGGNDYYTNPDSRQWIVVTSGALQWNNSLNNTSPTSVSVASIIGKKISFSANGKTISAEGATATGVWTSLPPQSTTATIGLFAGKGINASNVTSWTAKASAKYFLFDIERQSTPIRKFLPVRVGSGSTWEGAMMDVLTRRIYRNAGTGAFTYGNDLKYPIPAE